MKDKVFLGAEKLLGLIMIIFGANFFFHYLPMPPPNEAAGAFFGALFNTGYMFPWIKVTEIVTGLALLTGFFSPLALVVLAPIILNIAAAHFILDTSGAPLAVLLIVLAILASRRHKEAYAALLKVR